MASLSVLSKFHDSLEPSIVDRWLNELAAIEFSHVDSLFKRRRLNSGASTWSSGSSSSQGSDHRDNFIRYQPVEKNCSGLNCGWRAQVMSSQLANQPRHSPHARQSFQGQFEKRTKLSIRTSTFCSFCKSNREPETVYKSHSLRHPVTNAVLCPVLRAFVCPSCNNQNPDRAHTVSYCPKLRQRTDVNVQRNIRELSNRNSAGKVRRFY